MIFAWSLTETIRYMFYAEQLLIESTPDNEPTWQLLWARYTTFYALYPLGAGSEAACMIYTLPWFSQGAEWNVRAYAYLGLSIIWIPGEYDVLQIRFWQEADVCVFCDIFQVSSSCTPICSNSARRFWARVSGATSC